MENELFECDGGADNAGSFAWQFYNCTLKVPIGPHAAGTVWETIVMDCQNGRIELIAEDSTAFKYALHYQIGDPIKS